VSRLPEGLQAAQQGLLRMLHAIGLTADVHGQPAWPFAQRIATETLAIDGGLTRQLAWLIAGIALASLLVAVGALWRGGRPVCWLAALLALLVVPWPARSLVLTEAYATSFHRSPSSFDAASIERGVLLYRTHCASCHGVDGRGEGPRAASLPMWPPRLGGELLWRRLDGEVFWRILHGLRDRHGVETMPGAVGQFSDADVWALIDAMKALAAGTSVRVESTWAQPVRPPDARVRCDDGLPPRLLSSLRGQRLRLVAAVAALSVPREDPRLATIVLLAPGAPLAAADGACVIDDADAYAAYARVAGAEPARFAGAQFLVDRGGWLRAYGRPGASAWSQGDLLCRSEAPATIASPSRDGLGDLIAVIDADPIRSPGLRPSHGR